MSSQNHMASAQPLDMLLTVDETARLLRRSRRWIYANLDSLPAPVRIGRTRGILFNSEAIGRWLNARTGPVKGGSNAA